MEETPKKREWVKNAAIVFLAVMLVLTFFSNTFMNVSLPEVSTQYVTSGSINEKIRGSGTVTANQNYEVTLDEKQLGRKVDSILVRVGQEVAAGDLLFTLEPVTSDDAYYAAKDALTEAQIAYERVLLEASRDRYTTENRAVSDAAKALSDARKTANEALSAQKKIKAAEDDAAAKQASYDAIAAHLAVLSGKEEEIANLKALLSEATANKVAAQKALDSAKAVLDGLSSDDPGYGEANNAYLSALDTYTAWEKAESDYTAKLTALGVPDDYDTLYEQYLAAQKALDVANANLVATHNAYDSAALGNTDISSYEDTYDDAVENLKEAMESEKIDDKIQSLELEQASRAVEKAKRELAEYSAGGGSNEVTAKTAGVISAINVIAGKEPMDPTAMIIEQSDRGYSLSFAVTAEQAKKLSVGAPAEVSNYWWGSEIKATLESIKPDPTAGGRGKLLTFTITGDTSEGETLNLSIGQKGQNYDAIIPTSAVRTDSNGTFVLLLTTKQSPLGNRYVATRVDVKVLASDDTNSAVSGLGYGDYVITTSSKPIEPGTQVRMAEG